MLVFVITAPGSTSAPVPAVVGTHITGGNSIFVFLEIDKFKISLSQKSFGEACLDKAIALAKSKELPPPIAIIPSLSFSLKICKPKSTSSSLGFAEKSLKIDNVEWSTSN